MSGREEALLRSSETSARSFGTTGEGTVNVALRLEETERESNVSNTSQQGGPSSRIRDRNLSLGVGEDIVKMCCQLWRQLGYLMTGMLLLVNCVIWEMKKK